MTIIHIHEDTDRFEIHARSIETAIRIYLESTIWSFTDDEPLCTTWDYDINNEVPIKITATFNDGELILEEMAERVYTTSYHKFF